MFTDPLGLLALLGVPAVLALHLFRRRFRPHPVSALFLWHDGQEVLHAGRRIERLRPTATLACELLAALLLGLAFAGPRACSGGRARHLVCVLDGSASMLATGHSTTGDGEATADRARALVRERIQDLPSGSRVTLIRSDRRPRVLAGPAAFPAAALEALKEYEPRAPHHELASAAALALELAGDGPVLVVTDHFRPDELPAALELVALGRPCDNAALDHVTRLEEPGGGVLFATVAARSERPLFRELRLVAGGTELARASLELAPGAEQTVRLTLPAHLGPVEVRLSPDDLAPDDRAVLAPPVPRDVALGLDLEEELAGTLGLELPRLLRALPDVRAAGADGPDLRVARAGSAPRPAAVTLLLHPGDEASERLDLAGPFVVDRGHPLGSGLVLDGIVWSLSTDARLPGNPLVSAGDVPLLTEDERDGGRVFHLALDPRRSSLQRSPDWPVLLANLVELTRGELPGPSRTNLTLGEELVYVSAEPLDFVLRDPEGRELERAPARTRFVTDRFERPGLHRLEGDGRLLCEIGVRFADPLESNLLTATTDERPGEAPGGELLADRSRLASLLATLALGFVVLDWLVLRRTPLVASRGTRRTARA